MRHDVMIHEFMSHEQASHEFFLSMAAIEYVIQCHFISSFHDAKKSSGRPRTVLHNGLQYHSTTVLSSKVHPVPARGTVPGTSTEQRLHLVSYASTVQHARCTRYLVLESGVHGVLQYYCYSFLE